MLRDEELYWLQQPEWAINKEMERRLLAYFDHKGRLEEINKKIKDCKNILKDIEKEYVHK